MDDPWLKRRCGYFTENCAPPGCRAMTAVYQDRIKELEAEIQSLKTPAPDQVNKYTVILLYPDYATGDYGADIYVECAEGKDGYVATWNVQQMAMDANRDENGDAIIPAEDFRPIAVLKGDHILELDATCFSAAQCYEGPT